MTDKEIEVYKYVSSHASDHLAVIIKAVTDGIHNENLKLRESKSNVECGLVALLNTPPKIKKMNRANRFVLIRALENATFVKFDDEIVRLKEEYAKNP